MLDICFGDSEKGALKIAQRYSAQNMLCGAMAYIGKKPSVPELKERFAGQSLGGNPMDVIAVPFCLDVGNIQASITGDGRKKMLFDFLQGPWPEREQARQWETYWESCENELQRLLQQAQKGEHLRIWYSDAPYAACGLHFILWYLRDITCKITTIKLPQYSMAGEKTLVEYSGWGEVEPGRFASFLPLEQELPSAMRRAMTDRWSGLVKENAPLRALVNGKLVGVPADFYDSFLLRSMPQGNFKIAQLIGNAIGKYQLSVGDWWLYYRIQEMIAQHVLEVVQPADGDKAQASPYSAIVRQCGK